MSKKRDNTERYRCFSDSYEKAFMSATKEKGKKRDGCGMEPTVEIM